ncbi:MAG: hypothetical protein WA716_18130 [Pseudolabrys sp.]
MTDILGIQIPSTDPVFLTIVGFHILIGLACVISGAVAIFSRKGRGRHSRFGALYFWLLAVLFGSASILSLMRWTDDYHLFILGLLSFMSAILCLQFLDGQRLEVIGVAGQDFTSQAWAYRIS